MKKLFLITGFYFFVTGCSTYKAPFSPPIAPISIVQAPLDIDTDNTPVSPKKGTTSACTLLGLVTLGDLSYETAAKNGGISVIQSSDYEYRNIFYLYQEMILNVYGR